MASLSSWIPVDTGRSAFLVAARTAIGLFSAASLESSSLSVVFFDFVYLTPRGLSFFKPECCDAEASGVARILVVLEAAATPVRVIRVVGGAMVVFKRVDARVGGVDVELTDLGGIEHLAWRVVDCLSLFTTDRDQASRHAAYYFDSMWGTPPTSFSLRNFGHTG